MVTMTPMQILEALLRPLEEEVESGKQPEIITLSDDDDTITIKNAPIESRRSPASLVEPIKLGQLKNFALVPYLIEAMIMLPYKSVTILQIVDYIAREYPRFSTLRTETLNGVLREYIIFERLEWINEKVNMRHGILWRLRETPDLEKSLSCKKITINRDIASFTKIAEHLKQQLRRDGILPQEFYRGHVLNFQKETMTFEFYPYQKRDSKVDTATRVITHTELVIQALKEEHILTFRQIKRWIELREPQIAKNVKWKNMQCTISRKNDLFCRIMGLHEKGQCYYMLRQNIKKKDIIEAVKNMMKQKESQQQT